MFSLYNGTNQIRVSPTRFPGIGFANTNPAGKPLWRVIDINDFSNPQIVGEQYQTRAELLADLSDYVKRAGWQS